MVGPIRYIRKLNTPPCSTCKHCIGLIFGEVPSCCSSKYLDHTERVSSVKYKSAESNLVRGTRFCTYEKRESDAD